MRKGVSLLEFIISILILGIALIGVAPLLVQGIHITKSGSLTKDAVALAGELLEYVHQDPNYTTLETRYNDAPSARRNITDYPYFVSLGLSDDPRFKVNIKVTNNAVPGAYDKLKKITVRIFWQEQNRELCYTLVGFRRKL